MNFAATLKGQALAGLLVIAGTHSVAAQADNYAVSYNTISSFDINFTGSAGSLTPFTFSTSVAAQDSSEAHFAIQDAPAACSGAFCSALNNSFAMHGAIGEYAYGDAQIVNTSVLNNQGIAASIGEISAGSSGFASGSNTMTAYFTVLGDGGAVSFSFDALPYMQVSGIGSANTAMSITISGPAGQVFNWAPASLNLGITSGATYNPGALSFAAATGTLGMGTYTLNISMLNQVTAVPEPETWGMLLAGLGLVALQLRRKGNRAA